VQFTVFATVPVSNASQAQQELNKLLSSTSLRHQRLAQGVGPPSPPPTPTPLLNTLPNGSPIPQQKLVFADQPTIQIPGNANISCEAIQAAAKTAYYNAFADIPDFTLEDVSLSPCSSSQVMRAGAPPSDLVQNGLRGLTSWRRSRKGALRLSYSTTYTFSVACAVYPRYAPANWQQRNYQAAYTLQSEIIMQAETSTTVTLTTLNSESVTSLTYTQQESVVEALLGNSDNLVYEPVPVYPRRVYLRTSLYCGSASPGSVRLSCNSMQTAILNSCDNIGIPSEVVTIRSCEQVNEWDVVVHLQIDTYSTYASGFTAALRDNIQNGYYFEQVNTYETSCGSVEFYTDIVQYSYIDVIGTSSYVAPSATPTPTPTPTPVKWVEVVTERPAVGGVWIEWEYYCQALDVVEYWTCSEVAYVMQQTLAEVCGVFVSEIVIENCECIAVNGQGSVPASCSGFTTTSSGEVIFESAPMSTTTPTSTVLPLSSSVAPTPSAVLVTPTANAIVASATASPPETVTSAPVRSGTETPMPTASPTPAGTNTSAGAVQWHYNRVSGRVLTNAFQAQNVSQNMTTAYHSAHIKNTFARKLRELRHQRSHHNSSTNGNVSIQISQNRSLVSLDFLGKPSTLEPLYSVVQPGRLYDLSGRICTASCRPPGINDSDVSPANCCSGNGVCVSGVCYCVGGYRGLLCQNAPSSSSSSSSTSTASASPSPSSSALPSFPPPPSGYDAVDLLMELRGVSYSQFYNSTNNARFRDLLMQSIQSIAQISLVRIHVVGGSESYNSLHYMLMRAPTSVTTTGAVQLILKPSDVNVVTRLLSTVFLYEQVRQAFPPNGSVVSVEVRRVATGDPSQISGSGSGSGAPLGAIIGGAVAGAAALILAVLAVWLFLRRRRRRQQRQRNRTGTVPSSAALAGIAPGSRVFQNDTVDVAALKPTGSTAAALGTVDSANVVTMPLVVGPNATLRELARERLLYGMLAGTARSSLAGAEDSRGSSADQRRAPGMLVADDRGIQVLSAACRMSDLVGNGVFLVEELGQQPPTLNALPPSDQGRRLVYLFKPTSNAVNTLIASLEHVTKASDRGSGEHDDSETPKVSSKTIIEVFATSRVDETYLDRVRAASQLVERLAQFTELNIDFCAFEQRLFHLGRYPADLQPVRPQTIAESLLTLCSVLQERPRIRFARDSFTGAPAAVAEELVRILDEYGPLILPTRAGSAPRAGASRTVLLIVDRDCDLLTPLLHDDTYQTVLKQEFPSLLEADSGAGSQLVLDEYADDVWSLVRYRPVEQVGRLRTAKRGALATSTSDSNVLLPSDADAASLERHQRLARRAQDLWENAQIARIAALERDMLNAQRVVGTDAETRVRGQLRQLLDEDNIRLVDKARLIVLFALTQNTSTAEIQELVSMAFARSSFGEHQSWGSSQGSAALSSTSAGSSASTGTSTTASDIRTAPQLTAVIERLCIAYGVPLRKTPSEMQAMQQTHGRLAKLATLLIERRLGESAFPYAGESRHFDRAYMSDDSSAGELSDFSTDDEESGIRRTSRSLRRRRSSSAIRESSLGRRNRRRSSSSSVGSVDESATRRIIIFVIGGLSWNETRYAYDLSESSGTQVFFGGSCMLDARAFIEALVPTASDMLAGKCALEGSIPGALPPSSTKLVRSSSAAALSVLSQRKRSRSRSTSVTR